MDEPVYGTQQIRLHVTDAVRDYLAYQCRQANSLYNCTIYEVRQAHFAVCGRVEFFDEYGLYRSECRTERVNVTYEALCSQMQDNPHYQAVGGQGAQQTLKSVASAFSSYNELVKLFWQKEYPTCPGLPNYRKKGGLARLAYPAQAVEFNLETGECRIPTSRELKQEVHEHLQCQEIWIPGPHGIRAEQIVEVRILPRNREFYAEYVYQYEPKQSQLDKTQALGIDPGITNWLTCVSTRGKSFIIDGRKLKSLNRNYNRRVAKLKTGKDQGFWNDELAHITETRNRQMRDAINKTARFIVNYCLQHRLGTIVFGWNKGVKQKVELGSQTQPFVQIPTARLKNRIEQLCKEIGIQFIETEESYTSQASFVDGDFLPKYGEKPNNWKSSGKRGHRIKGCENNVGRGGYVTQQGWKVNADANGAANILRKVADQLGIILTGITQAALRLPQRYSVFKALSTSYRKQCEEQLQSSSNTTA